MRLRSLEMYNFMSFEGLTTIDFSANGFYFIKGYNKTGGDSNGSGKTAILSAISYALWGKTAGGLAGLDVKNWDTPVETYHVRLLLQDKSDIYEIYRGNLGLTFSINNKDLTGKKRDVQTLINDTFHSNYDIFFSSSFFTSSMADYLANLGDAGKKKLFKSILSLDKLDQAYIKTDGLLKLAKTDAAQLDISIMMREENLKNLEEDIAKYKELSTDFNFSKKERISALKSLMVEKPAEDPHLIWNLKIYEDKLLVALKAREDWDKIKDEIQDSLNQSYNALGRAESKAESLTLKVAELQVKNLGAPCEICGTPLGESFECLMQEKEQELENSKTEVYKHTLDVRTKELKIQRGTMLVEDWMEASEQRDLAAARLRDQEGVTKEWESRNKQILSDIALIESEVNTYDKLIDDNLHKIELLEEETSNLKTQFTAKSLEVDIRTYVKFLYSREGVTSKLIEKSLGALENLANMYLSRICHEGFRLHITPQRELKSKAIRDEIDVFITVNGKKRPYAAFSAGQRQRINIAMLMALYRLCRNRGVNIFDFLLLDEVIDLSLAERGQSDVVDALKELLPDISQIIIISHQEEVSRRFANIINVEYDGRSKINER